MTSINFHNVSEKMSAKGLLIQAKLQAKVWREQMKGTRHWIVHKKVAEKLRKKYPEISANKIDDLVLGELYF